MTNYFQSVATMKTLLILFNCSLWLLGVTMVVVGIALPLTLYDYIDVSSEDNRRVLLTVAILGAILTLTATLACCCTTHGHPALLYLYGAVLAVIALLVFGTAASIYAYRNGINEKFDQDFNDTMLAYGEPENKKKTAVLDTIQSNFRCCGNKAYTDWSYMLKKIPRSCCKVPLDTCDVDNVNDVYTQGCYSLLLDFINSNIGTVIGIAVIFYPLGPVFLACCLASNINKVKYVQVA